MQNKPWIFRRLSLRSVCWEKGVMVPFINVLTKKLGKSWQLNNLNKIVITNKKNYNIKK